MCSLIINLIQHSTETIVDDGTLAGTDVEYKLTTHGDAYKAGADDACEWTKLTEVLCHDGKGLGFLHPL